MKQFSIYFLGLGFLFLAACGSKKDDPTPDKPDAKVPTTEEVAKTTNALAGTWKWKSTTKKPSNVKDEDLKAFSITFAKPDAFTSQGAPAGLFSAEGKWAFAKDSNTQLNLTQKGNVGVMEISEPSTTMTVKFKSPSDAQNARTLGLDGDYELVLEKQ